MVWTEGSSRLLDYGASTGAAIPVLFVPSLVNRAYVLDVAQGHSLLRYLAKAPGARGRVRPFLLDWGWPETQERGFSLDDYVRRLISALEFVSLRPGKRAPVLAGYCMGGTLSVAAAALRPDLMAGLALLAAPWDFHAGGEQRARQAASVMASMEETLLAGGALPVDVLQAFFGMMDPEGIAQKYRDFGKLDPGSERARLFVALEDWLNDGIPLAAPVARSVFSGWYGCNDPALGAWRVLSELIEPARLRLPAFVATGARDRLVSPGSARPLAGLIQGAVLHEPDAGHIGMVAGAGAETALWRPLLAWLRSL